jgi:hypothetical protein
MIRLVIVLFVSILCATSLAKTPHAALPDVVMKAKTIYLDNEGDTSRFDNAYAEFQKWGRFAIVTTPEAADITVVFTTGSKMIDGTDYSRTTMKVFSKSSPQPAFEATDRAAKKCVEDFEKRFVAN